MLLHRDCRRQGHSISCEVLECCPTSQGSYSLTFIMLFTPEGLQAPPSAPIEPCFQNLLLSDSRRDESSNGGPILTASSSDLRHRSRPAPSSSKNVPSVSKRGLKRLWYVTFQKPGYFFCVQQLSRWHVERKLTKVFTPADHPFYVLRFQFR
ncbi:hypothetical protein BDZ97DRAFT_1368449 [Flammula alnicola]|nr:hypothetical protein BDZ97DRAFT_1368449 [Flammula alnicola]